MFRKDIFYILNQLNRQTIILLYVLFVCLAFLIFYYCYLNNKISQINILNSTISNMQNEIENNEIDKIMSDAKKLNDNLNSFKQKINPYLETYKIIDDLDNKIKKCNLSTIEFNLSRPQKVVINNNDNENTKQTICILEISLRLSGNYEGIRMMIDEILSGSYYYKISMLNISVLPDNLTEVSFLLNSYSKELDKSEEEKTLNFEDVSNYVNPFITKP